MSSHIAFKLKKVKGAFFMIPQKRLESLQNRKSIIASRIEEEERSPSVDPTTLRHLKKQKLELTEIIRGVRNDGDAIH